MSGLIIFLSIIGFAVFIVSKVRETPEVTDWQTPLGDTPNKKITPESINQNVDYKYYFKPTYQNILTIKALLFLCKADGQIREDELREIAKFLIQKQPEHNQTNEFYMIQNIKDLKPFTSAEYSAYIADQDKRNLLEFKKHMNSIFGTQKKNHPYEDILLSELQQAIDARI